MPTSSSELISRIRYAARTIYVGGNFYSAGGISSTNLRFINNALSSALALAMTLLLSRRWNRHPKE